MRGASPGKPNFNKLQLYRKASDGTGDEQLVPAFADRDEWLTDWSPDGRYLMFSSVDPQTRLDLWAVPANGDGKPFPVVKGPGDELNGRFSPDGRWVAYISNESGRNEVYLTPFQHGSGKWQVSTSGGNVVVWGRDSRTLNYTSGNNDIWAVQVTPKGDGMELGAPRKLLSTPMKALVSSSFDVMRDGRFLVISTGETAEAPLTLVTNWTEILKK